MIDLIDEFNTLVASSQKHPLIQYFVKLVLAVS